MSGNLFGKRNLTTLDGAKGVWSLREQYIASSTNTWPVVPIKDLTLISNVRSSIIPTNTISGKTQGFLGIIWQTGWNSSIYPTDITSPGWTRITGNTKITSTLYWRNSIQYKILTLAELGTNITPIVYTGASNIQIALFGTTDNIPIHRVTMGSVNTSTVNTPSSQILNSSSLSNIVTLSIAQYYNSPTPVTPTFTGATSVVIADGQDQQLRYYVSPYVDTIKPNITVGMGTGTYSQLNSFYMSII